MATHTDLEMLLLGLVLSLCMIMTVVAGLCVYGHYRYKARVGAHIRWLHRAVHSLHKAAAGQATVNRHHKVVLRHLMGVSNTQLKKS